MGEVGVVVQYKAVPRNEAAFEAAVQELFKAMAAEEYPQGAVKTFAFYKVPYIFGYWYSFGQFTQEGLANHGKGPKVSAAYKKMQALLAHPAEQEVLESVIIQGCGEHIPGAPPRPAEADPATDVGVVYSFRVKPEDDDTIDRLMHHIFKIVDRTEISTGNVLTYNLYRDPKEKGRWVMFEHFTAKGSADHATHPDVFPPGLKQIGLVTEPFSRVLLNPYIVHGCGETMPNGKA
ncbi:MAG TPA: hypothetical protein VL918_05755 [Sphingobium sp.]|nr:hypothetical protein [Sphingobium sp.]